MALAKFRKFWIILSRGWQSATDGWKNNLPTSALVFSFAVRLPSFPVGLLRSPVGLASLD